jgi:hypothetical protein
MDCLKQWVCDVCGQVIKSPKEGYVVWKYREIYNGYFEYKILHQNSYDEHKNKTGCDKDKTYISSLPLENFLGIEGMVTLLGMIDPGPLHLPEYKEQISNIRCFLEFFRRVQLPYYEEARLYWENAKNDGFFERANDIEIYLPSTLQEIIQKYNMNP